MKITVGTLKRIIIEETRRVMEAPHDSFEGINGEDIAKALGEKQRLFFGGMGQDEVRALKKMGEYLIKKGFLEQVGPDQAVPTQKLEDLAEQISGYVGRGGRRGGGALPASVAHVYRLVSEAFPELKQRNAMALQDIAKRLSAKVGMTSKQMRI